MTTEKELVRKAPETWCAGKGILCGYYNLRKQFLLALSEYMNKHKLEKDDIIGVSGIGCSGRFTVWQDVMTIHATHGNAANLAQGIALTREINKKKGLIYVVSGDGDALAVGRSNFEDLCSNNANVTYMVLNNSIYAMTSGQTAPTTSLGVKTISSPYGNLESPWDVATIALESGASFVAKVSSYPTDSKLLKDIIYESFEHDGTAVIEVISPCQTQNPNNKNKNLKVLEQEYLDDSVTMNIFKHLPYGIDDPLMRYLYIKNYINKNYNKSFVRGIIHQSDRTSYSKEVLKQKKEVKKIYGHRKLGKNLEKILKDKKIESF